MQIGELYGKSEIHGNGVAGGGSPGTWTVLFSSSSFIFYCMLFSRRSIYTHDIYFFSSSILHFDVVCALDTQRNIPIHLAVLMFFRDVIRVRTIGWIRELVYFVVAVVVVVRKRERVTIRSVISVRRRPATFYRPFCRADCHFLLWPNCA